MPRTTLSRRDALIVAPDSPATAPAVASLHAHLLRLTGEDLDILPGSAITDDEYHTRHLIVIGHLTNNPVMRRLYITRYSFIDAGYPGGDGLFVKSITDPFGAGRNVILVGGSTDAGLIAACDRLAGLIGQTGADLNHLHAVQSTLAIPETPAASEIDRLVADGIASWRVGWTSSPLSSATAYGLYYFLTAHPVWAELFARTLTGSIPAWADRPDDAKAQHVFFGLHQLIHIWDLIELSPCFSDDDRAGIASLLLTLLHHIAHTSYFWPGAIPDGEIRQNHLGFICLSLFYGWRYFTRRHGSDALAYRLPDIERTFNGQARSYKANDDAGCGYAWIIPRQTAHYFLARDDERYFRDGHVRALADLALATIDNRGDECTYGDTGGYGRGVGGALWALAAASWYHGDERYIQAYRRLSGNRPLTVGDLLEGPYRTPELVNPSSSSEPRIPDPESPVSPVFLDTAPLEWVGHHTPFVPRPDARYFDKLALRQSFDPQDEYLLLEGSGTFSHGHEDTNAIVRLTWRDRLWLADADYIRATPQFHNAVVIVKDGESFSPPPVASLVHVSEAGPITVVQTEAAPYNGMAWRRHIVWRKGEYFLILDELTAQTAGEFVVECLWRLLGQMTLRDGDTFVQQDGVTLAVRNADGSRRWVVEEENRGKSNWNAYEHADGVVRVLHQRLARPLSHGERLVFASLFCIADGATVPYTVERLDERTYVVRGAERTDTVRLGEPAEMVKTVAQLRMGHVATVSFDAPICASCRTPSGGLLVGTGTGEIVGIDQEGTVTRLACLDDRPVSLHTADIDGDGRPETLVGTDRARLVVIDADGHVRWERLCDAFFGRETKVTAITAGRDRSGAPLIYAGTTGWHVYAFDGTGEERWRRQIKYHGVTALLAADLDGDGREEVAVGTEYSTPLNLLDDDGRIRWFTWEQVGSEGRSTTEWCGVHLTHLTAADVDGDGRQELIFGTLANTVYVLRVEDGRVVWKANVGGAVTGLFAGDIDGDGRVEVIAGGEHGHLHLFDAAGRRRWHRTVGERLAAVAVADLDGDSCADILAGTPDGRVGVYDRAGGLMADSTLSGTITQLFPDSAGHVTILGGNTVVCVRGERRTS
ncbi:MAG: VCBS repeat-containing protein [Candidatus Latescibacteria bacterium]|nr:VCBS repeat-containing protein [Candidatus Latescibacterota bacterium]